MKNHKSMLLIVLAMVLMLTMVMPISAQGRRDLPSIKDIAVGNPDFSTLAALVVQAGPADALDGNRHYTVFAPTNAAFAKIDPQVLTDIVNAGLLEDVQLYHITRGDRQSQSVVNVRQIKMLNGAAIYPDGTTLNTSCNSVGITACGGQKVDP